ncbi:MAG: amidohydrolase family protein [Gemmatimonadales bacterium]
MRDFVLAGGRVAAGSGTPDPSLVPGESLHREIELLAGAGLSSLDALRAATLWSADLLRADSLGRIRPGAAADLIVLRRDPVAAVANVRAVSRVMLGGKWVAVPRPPRG